MYGQGKGAKQDYVEAVKYWRLASAQGYARAQFNLGNMYGKGKGVKQDYVTAHMWYDLAAAQGNSYAVNGRYITAKVMTQQQIAQAQKLARECLARKYKGC
jgi:TPR repeat protein